MVGNPFEVYNRFSGRLLSSAEHKAVFAGDDEGTRMSLVRQHINAVREAWSDHAAYRNLVDAVIDFTQPEKQPSEVRLPLQRLFDGYRDYADINLSRPGQGAPEQYDALELYCSKEGYDFLFRLVSQTLRQENVAVELLRAAVTLIELLTIDMYNLRLSQIGHDKYANFQGITYRGMQLDAATAEAYREVANRKELSKRGFSIPLAPISTSTDEAIMEQFAQIDRNPGLDEMYWKIHIHGVDAYLLQEYCQKYPTSIVTTICSMPVGHLSPFGEKEILLRGAFFQLLRMTTEPRDTYSVHKLELVMINANRDHTSETGSNVGNKKRQRDAFRRIAMASRYEVCEALAANFSPAEATGYAALQQNALNELRDIDEITADREQDLAEVWSTGSAIWLGATTVRSFPGHYTQVRRTWQNHVHEHNWDKVDEVMETEYDWRRGDWCNIVKISDGYKATTDSYTLLHELALAGIPGECSTGYVAWKRLIKRAQAGHVWRTLRTDGGLGSTAQELARHRGEQVLVTAFAPVVKTTIPSHIISRLEMQLHVLMDQYAGKFLVEHAFNMPQLSILTEMEEPRLWIPIPHMYGGFFIHLRDHSLHVKIFETVVNEAKPKITSVMLAGQPHAPEHVETSQFRHPALLQVPSFA